MTFQIALGCFSFFPSFFLYLTPSLYRALSLSHFPVQITCTLRFSFILFPNPPILTMFFNFLVSLVISGYVLISEDVYLDEEGHTTFFFLCQGYLTQYDLL